MNNNNIDLTKILKDCPKGWKLYSTTLGYVTVQEIDNNNVPYPIIVITKDRVIENFTIDGKIIKDYDGECTLFPSKEQRDWSKFTAPWYTKDKFDPNTLQPFDKVLIREHRNCVWKCNLFSHVVGTKKCYPCRCISGVYKYCIPYNDDTKYLINTTEEVPEYYKYWED